MFPSDPDVNERGDVLVFVSGLREINTLINALGNVAHHRLMFHSTLHHPVVGCCCDFTPLSLILNSS